MTREEAVTVLKAFMENPLFSDVHKQAFNIAIHDIKQRHDWDINNLILINKDNYEALEQEPTTKNDLEVEVIDRAELLKAMDTWDKFGNDPNKGLIILRTPALKGRYIPYVKYDDMVNCVKGMPIVTPQEPILDKIRAEIEPKCDRINSLASVLTYTAHREIQELLCEIIDLCKVETEKSNG